MEQEEGGSAIRSPVSGSLECVAVVFGVGNRDNGKRRRFAPINMNGNRLRSTINKDNSCAYRTSAIKQESSYKFLGNDLLCLCVLTVHRLSLSHLLLLLLSVGLMMMIYIREVSPGKRKNSTATEMR